MAPRSERLLWALLGAVIVECAIGIVLRSDQVRAMLEGHTHWRGILAVLGLVWSLAVLALVFRLGGRLGELRTTLLRREQQIDAVAKTSYEWTWESDAEFRMTHCSPQVERLLGLRPEELLGRDALELVYPLDRDRARSILDAARADASGWRDIELRWHHASGQLVSLQGSAVALTDAGGALVGFRGSRRLTPADAREGQRLAAARERVERVLGTAELDFALQPVVSLESGKFVGAEALARFRDNRPPDVWFAEAQEVGLGVELELLALRAGLRLLPEMPPDVRLAINASPELVVDHRFGAELSRLDDDIQRLCVEITEHAAVAQYASLRHALTPLRERGLSLAVDDTGAGYASLSHVLRLRPDCIKLDRSLIADIDQDAARRALVTALVLLALELEATVTAEGVETAAELSTLADLGVDDVQGYLLARPGTDRGQWARWATRSWPVPVPAATPV